MKLVAITTLHTPKGVVQPGESIDIKDKDEAAYLVQIGAASDPADRSSGAVDADADAG